MQKQDLQQISNLLDQKFDQKFKDNNETLLKRVDEKMDKKFKDNNEILLKKTDEKFDAVDKKFDAVDKKFDAVDKKFDAVDKKFDVVGKKFDVVGKKFDVMNKKIDELATETGKKFDAALLLFATKEDLKDLKRELKEDMAKETNKILNAVDGIAKKHEDFKTELAANIGAHERFENKFTKTNQRVEVLEKKLDIQFIE